MVQSIDLLNIDNQIIYAPGSIQPHGVLLALSEPELTILHVSKNVSDFFQKTAEELVGHSLDLIFESSQIEVLKGCLKHEQITIYNPLKLSVNQAEKLNFFDGIIHRTDGVLILELEPALSEEQVNFKDFYPLIKSAHQRMIEAKNLEELCQFIVQEIRKLTGFDRVLVYKFAQDMHGMVIAEEVSEDLPSFLGLHYPASDIPDQARTSYEQNYWLRLIADVNSEQSAIIPPNNSLTKEPLNLTFSVLRSVNKCHTKYLKNMGIGASMSISVIKDKNLWGLVVGHHATAKYVPYEIRQACEFLGQNMSREIVSKEELEDYEYQLELASIENQIITTISGSDDWKSTLVNDHPNLLDLVQAQGAVIYSGTDDILVGETPNIEAIRRLVSWLEKNHPQTVFSTDNLLKIYPEAASYKDMGSGILAVRITRPPGYAKYIIWFRSEMIRTVNWAGNPDEPFQVVIINDEAKELTPRHSFSLWKETVRGQSLPWKKCEIQAAITLRDAIVNIVLRQTEELAKLNQELQEAETREREKAQQLEKTLEKLKRMQTQLIQSEKLSTLGQLVAGIAHEINNPINFISGNLSYANDYANDLLELVEVYQEKYANPDQEVAEKIEEIELDYLREDLPKLLSSMKVGAERISSLVMSLRNFSRVDEAQLKPVNIHDGIDSTLLILQNRLKAKSETSGIVIIKDYNYKHQVECYPSILNQVFLNLITNAIDALEEYGLKPADRPADYKPQIKVTTKSLEGNRLQISIADNGPGMSKEVQGQIYDPFFSTKPVGKGTGLGLAMAYSIVVEQHQGQLICQSKTGEGTEFIIEIPAKQLPK